MGPKLVTYFAVVIISTLNVDSKSVFGPFEDELSSELNFDSSEEEYPSRPQFFDNRDSVLEEPRFHSPKVYMLTFRPSSIISNPHLGDYSFQHYPRRHIFDSMIFPTEADYLDNSQIEDSQVFDRNWNNLKIEKSVESVEDDGQNEFMPWRKQIQENVYHDHDEGQMPPSLIMQRLLMQNLIKSIKDKESTDQNIPQQRKTEYDHKIQEIKSIIKDMPTVVQI